MSMDLFTRCPACKTAFRVTTQQLQVSGGQVRCGQCQAVFDAYASLTAQEPPAPIPPPEPIAREADRPEATETVASEVVQVAAKGPPAPAPARTDRPDPAAELYEWEFRMPESRSHTALWAVLATLLVVLLGLQAAYAFRSEIMVAVPESRAYYQKICDVAGCKIGLPKLASYLHLEASDMNVVDAAHPSEIQLVLSVRNRAPVDLAYPDFELTLTDSTERAIARRVFTPADYLPAGRPSGGLKAGGDLVVQLYLDTGNLRASGYRVYMFYQ